MKKGLFILTIAAVMVSCEGRSLSLREGRWQGELVLGDQSIAIILDRTDGEYLLSIPAQGLTKAPLSQVQGTGNNLSLRLALPNGEARFEGKPEEDGFSGKFLQGALAGTFSLSHTGPIPAAAAAPMEPAGTDRAVTLRTEEGTLWGQVREPFTDTGIWAALIIAGSGPTDGDGNSPLLPGKNNSLLRLANELAAMGVPTLRYDKRGAGKSGEAFGKEEDFRFADLIGDAAGWYSELQTQFPARSYILIGHSEGSLVALALANQAGADAVISIAGSGYPIDITLEKQLHSFGPEMEPKAKEILDRLRRGERVSSVPQQLMSLFRPSVQPYLLSWFTYDPRTLITGLACPVLILQGEQDLQTSQEDALALKEAAPAARMAILPRMNHLLRDVADETENRATYVEDRLPLSPGLIKEIGDFLLSVE